MSNDTDTGLPPSEVDASGMSRRTLLRSSALVGAIGLSGAALAACSGDDAGSSTGTTTSPTADASSPAATTTGEAAPTSAPAGAASGPVLAKAADVPVGGALVAEAPDGEKYVVVQATQGQFTGLSAICTHQRCTVGVAGDRLDCPCHGSRYTLTGTVLRGPATAPLPSANVALSGEDVVLTT
jgi:cytochrome b6-f complex iron-sulfur subunit